MAAKSNAPDITSWISHGRNVRSQMIDGVLFLAINAKPDAFKGLAPTAKGNVTIASTLGNVSLPETNLKLGLNVYGPPPAV